MGAKVITFFNNKGGVSKTTTCFNLGWMLAERGATVIIVDADPQCNLTGMVLDLTGTEALAKYYKEFPGRNIRDALEPAFASRPVPLKAVEAVPVPGRDGLSLVPGHVGLAEYDVSLGIAQQLSESVQALKNLPGSIRYLLDQTAEAAGADYVLVDLSPGLGSLNQNLVTTSDFFAVPASPDVFSVMAMESLARVLPRWISWATHAAALEALSGADYPFPPPNLKFIGTIVQRYRLRGGEPTVAFQEYFDRLDEVVRDTLRPSLDKAGLLLPHQSYASVGMDETLKLGSVPDFNSLIAVTQRIRKPVFMLTQSDTGHGGFVWENEEKSIQSFREIFAEMATRIEGLCANDPPTS